MKHLAVIRPTEAAHRRAWQGCCLCGWAGARVLEPETARQEADNHVRGER